MSPPVGLVGTGFRSASLASTTSNPRESVQKSSSTEMSKLRLVTASQTPGRWGAMTASMPAAKLATFRCSTMTPLGVPVEPEV